MKTDKGNEENATSGYRSRFQHENEAAKAGYYSVLLDNYKVKVELTAGDRVGMMRCTFPQSDKSHIFLDMVEGVNDEFVYESFLQLEAPNAISGFRRTRDWAQDQYLYFYAEFSKSFKDYTFLNLADILNVDSVKPNRIEGDSIKAYFDFDTEEGEQIVMRIAISAVDVEGAKNNLKAELAENDFDFDALKQKAYDKWNKELKRYEVADPNESNKTVFYSALYHCMVAPNLYSDADGRYRAHDLKVYNSKRPVYTVFSLWDTFRSLHPLFSLMQRERTLDFINTFINKYETNSHHMLPIWELAANETYCMIGNHAIPVIADAYFAGIRDFDTEKALEAMVASSKDDFRGMGAYMKYGYIPIESEGEAVSKTLEYAYDDWCIAQAARLLGHDDDYAFFIERSRNYRNLIDPETKYMRGRDSEGAWRMPFAPVAYQGPGSVNGWGDITEGFTMQYTWTVPHAFEDYMEIAGRKFLCDRLDGIFKLEMSDDIPGAHDIWGRIGGYWHGNEPCHHVLYLYNKLGKPQECQKWVRYVADHFYGNKPDSLSGNDDCGQMSAWYIFNCLGFYPLCPGSNEYELGSPCLPGVRVRLSDGGVLTVRTKNWSPDHVYVKAVYLNGRKLTGSTLRYEDIRDGADLLFVMR